ncbi:hypothetical protein COX84_05910 [Candidatus Micrarchaeota archaeon CG_4_10_14_0_2_um_filter_49_7]|nr:MAG: hypothetical protein COX84_05910 [Candidatus Micrarchaeota archaeon CG_4_10_14_0_2_um_filter_49_7]
MFGSVSPICANLAEMAAFTSKPAQRQKVIVCIGECNEAEYWLDLCSAIEILDRENHDRFANQLIAIRKQLFNLLTIITKSC